MVVLNREINERMRVKVLSVLIFIPLFIRGFSQPVQDTVPSGNVKNAIYGTFGVFPMAVYNINYERNILKPDTSSVSSINLRLGYGKEGDLSGSAEMLLTSANFIFGQ